MDELDLNHGFGRLAISAVCIYILPHIIKGVWAVYNRNKGPTGEQFRELTKALTETQMALKEQKMVTEKMALDFRRIYLFLKAIAGEKWPKYRKMVDDIERDQFGA